MLVKINQYTKKMKNTVLTDEGFKGFQVIIYLIFS